MTQAQAIDEVVRAWRSEPEVVRRFVLNGDHTLVVAVDGGELDRVSVMVATDAPGNLWLHWGLGVRGVAKGRGSQWNAAAQGDWPPGSKRFDDRAVRSPLVRQEPVGGVAKLEIVLRAEGDTLARAINFVLYDATAQTWLKDRGGDMHVPIPRRQAEDDARIDDLVETIAEAEVGDHSWTLMHRFNLCYELIDEVDESSGEAGMRRLGVLFVWLRFSSLRQLTWQRRYNTQPRELSHAQDRLTRRLGSLYEAGSERGAILRMMLGMLGRGGEGQAIRDEILHIMHRHGIKESHGTWMEQWHQKLHNNTTPDDVVICQAYLAFLRSDGDMGAYDRVLAAEGIDRARLASFERPITADPPFYGDRKDALIGAFEHFLRLLRSVHSGTDLSSSLNAAGHCLHEGFRNWIWAIVHEPVETSDQLLRVVGELVDARRQLRQRIDEAQDPGAMRDMLYVDLGVEQRIRKTIEGFDLSRLDVAALLTLAGQGAVAVDLSWPGAGFRLAAKHADRLAGQVREDRLMLLEAIGLAERLSRDVQAATDRMHALLQSIAERLGKSLKVETWTVPIFSEELIRGTLLFVVSRVLRRLDVLLREQAGIGGWQIVSPGQATGRVRLTSSLREVQAERFDEPTIVIADEITGDEELPEGVRAVVGRRPVDLVSHVAVRARNGKVLLAGCLEQAAYQSLRECGGERMAMRSTAEGNLAIEPATQGVEQAAGEPDGEDKLRATLADVTLEAGVLTADAFTQKRVGAKAMNLARLARALPTAAKLPRGIALAFGTFEAALDQSENRQAGEQYRALVAKVDDSPAQTLAKLRDCVASLHPWEQLQVRVGAAGKRAGLALEAEFSEIFRAIARVWASQWTDRAYWSRRRLGIDHDALHMAVLIQEMIPAELAFVLHTVDPTTGNRDELLGEVVPGLGETLVANEPGRALAFVAHKAAASDHRILSFPSKSSALRGGGLICRSDSNGEDLAAYAGAGLYDSIPVPSPRRELIDVTEERIVTDGVYRGDIIRRLTELGAVIEAKFGGAQDIEGAVVGEDLYVVQTRPQVGL